MAMDSYSGKLRTMQQYVPFLVKMIAKLEKARDVKDPELAKVRNLHGILTDGTKKVKLEMLLKCEEVIQKLYEKVEGVPPSSIRQPDTRDSPAQHKIPEETRSKDHKHKHHSESAGASNKDHNGHQENPNQNQHHESSKKMKKYSKLKMDTGVDIRNYFHRSSIDDPDVFVTKVTNRKDRTGGRHHQHKNDNVNSKNEKSDSDSSSLRKTTSRKRKGRRIESSTEESDGNADSELEDRPTSSLSATFKKLKKTPKVDIEKISAKKVKEPTSAPSTSTSKTAKRKLYTLRSSDEEEDDDPKPPVVRVQDAIDQFIAACKKFLPKDEAEPVVKKIQKHVKNLSREFVSCPKLKLVVEKNYSLLDSNRDDIYVYVKNLLDELKKCKKGVDSEAAQMSNNQSSPDKYEGGSSETSNIQTSNKKSDKKGPIEASKTTTKDPSKQTSEPSKKPSKQTSEPSKTATKEPSKQTSGTSKTVTKEPNKQTSSRSEPSKTPNKVNNEKDGIREMPSRDSKIKGRYKKLRLEPQVDIRNYFQNINLKDPHKFVTNVRNCKNESFPKNKNKLDDTIILDESESESSKGSARKASKSKAQSSAKVDIMLDKLRQNGFSVSKNEQSKSGQAAAPTGSTANKGPSVQQGRVNPGQSNPSPSGGANKENANESPGVAWNDINFEHEKSCVQNCLMMTGMQRNALVAAGVFMVSTFSINHNYISICTKILACCTRLGDLAAGRDVLTLLSQLRASPGINIACKTMIEMLFQQRSQVLNEIDKLERASMESLKKKDYASALASLDFALKLATGCLRLQMMRGDCLAFLGRYAEAVNVSSSILLKDRRNVAALFQMGFCLFHSDNVERAINNFQQVLQISPGHSKATTLLSRAKQYKDKMEAAAKAVASNRLKEAHIIYAEICEIGPRNKTTFANILTKSAEVLAKMKRFDESLAELDKALEVDSNCLAALFQRANYYLKQKELEKAVTDLEKIQNLDINKQQSKKKAAEDALKCGRREEAYNLFCEAIEVDKHNQTYKNIFRKAKKDLEMASRKDYYKILGIEKTCEESAIKKAYYKKSKEYHPDRHANADEEQKNEFNARFTEVKLAYEVLSDKQKKFMYDSGNDVKLPPGGGWYCPLNPRILQNMFPEKFRMNGGQVSRGGRQPNIGRVGPIGPIGAANNIHEANRRKWQEEALTKEAMAKNKQLSREEAKVWVWIIVGDAGQRRLAKVQKELLTGRGRGKTRGGRGGRWGRAGV